MNLHLAGIYSVHQFGQIVRSNDHTNQVGTVASIILLNVHESSLSQIVTCHIAAYTIPVITIAIENQIQAIKLFKNIDLIDFIIIKLLNN